MIIIIINKFLLFDMKRYTPLNLASLLLQCDILGGLVGGHHQTLTCVVNKEIV